MSASDRLEVIRRHLAARSSLETPSQLSTNKCSAKGSAKPGSQSNHKSMLSGTIPVRRQDVLRWNGWGYKDSGFVVKEMQSGAYEVYFEGDRYGIGNLPLPNFEEWVRESVGVQFQYSSNVQPEYKDIPPPIVNEGFLSDLVESQIMHSTDGDDRLVRAHGQTLKEIFILQGGKFDRIPDVVVWPTSHNDVINLVASANKHDVVIIPIGGGTGVAGALVCPKDEQRMIVSLDMTRMNKIMWLDEVNLTAHIEAGIIGQDLERLLAIRGYTTGHEPDSLEFSSLGGWVATRASGMKKNVYGNIEDLVVHLKMVTPMGVVEKNCEAPRVSTGPDVHHFILGSEGTLGVITEVTMKIRPLPQCRKYGSLVFATFDAGVACLRQIAKERCAPASIRLMDNEQFKFGMALRPGGKSIFSSFADSLKKAYLTKLKGIDLNQMCVATLLFEGQTEDVKVQEAKVYNIAHRHGGIPGGEENGKRGYKLTYVIAYIRDLGLKYFIVAESFETSMTWDRVLPLCSNVKQRIREECRKRNIKTVFVTCRVTQTYDAGACVYFYFAYNYYNLVNPAEIYEEIEAIAREEVLANGGSLSHHHGVGKLRKHWLTNCISVPGMGMLKGIKDSVDPRNIFANGNLMN